MSIERDETDGPRVYGSASGSVYLSGRVTAKARHNLAVSHIQAAAFFAREAGKIESSFTGTLSEETAPIYAQHRAYVMGAVLTSVAFLEATANELFADASDNAQALVSALGEPIVKIMAELWDDGEGSIENDKVFSKYRQALIIAQRPKLETSRAPYQDAFLLVQLRNALVHFKPEWTPSGEDPAWRGKSRSLEAKLRGKFGLSKLYEGTGNAFFPSKCLGCECANWVVKSSIAFVDEFHSRLGLEPRYASVRSSLVV